MGGQALDGAVLENVPDGELEAGPTCRGGQAHRHDAVATELEEVVTCPDLGASEHLPEEVSQLVFLLGARGAADVRV